MCTHEAPRLCAQACFGVKSIPACMWSLLVAHSNTETRAPVVLYNYDPCSQSVHMAGYQE